MMAPDTPEGFTSAASAFFLTAGPNTFRRVGQRLVAKSMTARVSSRARESHPFRPPAIQTAGVQASVRRKLGGQVPRAIFQSSSLVVVNIGRAEGLIHPSGVRDQWRTNVRTRSTSRCHSFDRARPWCAPVRPTTPRHPTDVQLAKNLFSSKASCFRHR